MQPFFFLRHNGKFVKMHFHEIIYVESCKNYVRIITTTQTWMLLLSMKHLEGHLPTNLFCRVHRSNIVSLQHIVAFDHSTVYLNGGITVPLGEQYKPRLQGSITILSGESRAKLSVSETGMECLLEKES